MNTLTTCSWDSTVKLWDVGRMTEPVSTFFDHESAVKSVRLNQDANLLLSASDTGKSIPLVLTLD